MSEHKVTQTTSSSSRTISRTEPERHNEHSPYSSNLNESNKWKKLYLEDAKNDKEDIYGKAARASTGLTHELQVAIAAPKHAYIPNDREFISDPTNQTTGATAESGWSNEQTLPHASYRGEPTNLEDTLPKNKDNSQKWSGEEAQSPTGWIHRFSTQLTKSFGAPIAAPNQAHFPNERNIERPAEKESSETKVHDNPPGDTDHEASVTGRKKNNGFEKTKKLIADIFLKRLTCIDGSGSRTQAKSCEDLPRDEKKLYEKAADDFIKLILEIFVKDKQRYGAGTTVRDFMIAGILDETYMVPDDGEKNPYLYGEWEFLWETDKEDAAKKESHVSANVTQVRHPWSVKNRSCVSENLIPTAEDWKWWFGEWKKVPGAILEWKPREEKWPWQREYWVKIHAMRRDSEIEGIVPERAPT